MTTTKEYAPRLSRSDQRCIWFARTCRETNLDPLDLARLCALTRQAFAAGERAANTGADDDAAAERVEAHAASMGLTTQWPGLYPRFTIEATGATLQLEVKP